MGLLERMDALDRWAGVDAPPASPGWRRLTVVVVVVAIAVGLIPVGAPLWNGYRDREIADRLRREGVTAQAYVVDVSHKRRGRSMAGERAKVSFQTGSGERVTTWVPVQDAPATGASPQVRYLPSHPATARFVDDPAPRSGLKPVLVGLTYLVGLVVASVVTMGKAAISARPPRR